MSTAADQACTIYLVERPDATVAHLCGEIDVALRADASRALARMLERSLPIVLDTSEVTFIDSTGLAFLIQCSRFGHEQGVSVTLQDTAETVSALLALVGADDLFDAESHQGSPS
jgi:anti-anti-sigma factor